jgi:Zn-dependent peptidase ImmA (M78 family)
VTKVDDSTLDPDERRGVEERARRLLDRASAWGVFPTPIDDIVAAANLKVAPKSIFDLQAIAAYLKDKAIETGQNLKSAVSKLFGLYDSNDSIIHIDESVGETKQNFLKLHETGHHELPAHRKIFKFFQDCEKTLEPEIADQFEREANNFARFAMFQGSAYADQARDNAMSIKTPMRLAKEFGASQYASAREFARTHHRACAVYILEPPVYAQGDGFRAGVRRIETSASFRQQFGLPMCTAVTPSHFLGRTIPYGKRRMTAPMTLSIADLNGVKHECVAEAFNTTYNILVLLYPKAALTKVTIIMPPGFAASA